MRIYLFIYNVIHKTQERPLGTLLRCFRVCLH
nr:MAG TPA: hypothetical protein [Caudoviricetes sp.]